MHVIGVLLEKSEEPIVEEFFQLFKTPWMGYQPEHSFDVVMTDQQDLSGLDATLIIVFQKPSAEPFDPSDAQGCPQPTPVVLRQPDGPEFPVYTGVIALPAGNSRLTVKATGQCAGRLEEQAQRIVLRLGFHLFDEVRFILQHGQPLAYALVPTLDIHIANLRKWILAAGLPLIEIPPHPQGNPFFACLTHDVDFAGIRHHRFDRTLAGFVYRALFASTAGFLRGRYSWRHVMRNWQAVAMLPLIFAGLKKDFWFQFQKYVEIENGRPSTFFLVPFKGTPGKSENGAPIAGRAVKYDAADLKSEIDYLLQRGCEVGVHGLDAWLELDAARAELGKIQTLTGNTGLGTRMHWLCFNHGTPSLLESAGYKYDATSGYNETAGYRSGTFQVFKPPRAEKMLALPLHIMDTSLFYPDRMNLTFDNGLEIIKAFGDSVQTYGGVLTLNWHHRSIAPERLWDGVYRAALAALSSRAARFATAGVVVDWFEKRRAVVFESIVGSCRSICVDLSVNGRAVSEADDLVLRVHTPNGHAQGFQKSFFRDDVLHARHEISIWPGRHRQHP